MALGRIEMFRYDHVPVIDSWPDHVITRGVPDGEGCRISKGSSVKPSRDRGVLKHWVAGYVRTRAQSPIGWIAQRSDGKRAATLELSDGPHRPSAQQYIADATRSPSFT